MVGFELRIECFVGVVFEQHGVGEGVEEGDLRVVGIAALIEAEFGEEIAFVEGVSIGDKGPIEVDLDIGMDLVVALWEEVEDGRAREEDDAEEESDEHKSSFGLFAFTGFEGGVYALSVSLLCGIGEVDLRGTIGGYSVGSGGVIAEIIGNSGSCKRSGRSWALEATVLFGGGCTGGGVTRAIHFPLFGRWGGLEVLEFGPIGHGAPKLAIVGELFVSLEFAVLEHVADL